MKPLRAAAIRGNWATLLLPVRPDDAIDEHLLREEIRQLRAAGVNGVYTNGSAGEFYTQTEAEFDRLHAIVAEECERLQLPFQIGVAHSSPQISRERLARARGLAPSAVQVILPDWFPPSLAEVHRFLEGMAQAAGGIPLVLYNPPHAKRRLEPAEWPEVVSRHPCVQGAKLPGGDEAWYTAMRPILAGISVFIPGHFLATGLVHGARGAYSNVACLSPAGAQHWYDLCLRDPERGLALQERIVRFLFDSVVPFARERQLSNMACDKALAVAGGWLPGLSPRLRWPYASFPDEECRRLGELARSGLPELFR